MVGFSVDANSAVWKKLPFSALAYRAGPKSLIHAVRTGEKKLALAAKTALASYPNIWLPSSKQLVSMSATWTRPSLWFRPFFHANTRPSSANMRIRPNLPGDLSSLASGTSPCPAFLGPPLPPSLPDRYRTDVGSPSEALALNSAKRFTNYPPVSAARSAGSHLHQS